MAQGQVTKIYELRTLGYDDLSKQLDNVTAKFEAIKKAKLSASGKLAAAQDVADLKKYADELSKLKVEEQQYRTERQKLLTEQKAATIQRQAEINQRKQEQKSVEAAAGSYAELYKQYKELYALVKAAPKGSPVTFQGNTLQFDQAIAKLQQLAAAEQDFRRQFSRDSLLVGEYTSGIVQAFKKMGLDDLVGGQITKAQTHLQALNNEFNELKQELSEIKVTGNGSLEAVEQQLVQNRKAAQQLQSQIGTLQAEFRGVGDVGNQITESLKNGFKSLGKNITSFALQFYGISTVLNKLYSGIQNTISENAYLSDSFADLQRIMGATEAQTNAVVAALRKIDTRTSLKGLTDIAIIAARAGVAADDIAGVTKAIDQLNIVAGKELGNVEDATNSLVRLVNIFTTDGKVTEDSILSIGNGLISLANAGTASGDYLIDFSKRMAGVAKTAHIAVPAVLGLGAGFQELGTSAQIAGTTTSKIMFEIGQDVPKFAGIAGKSVKDFSETLKTAPAEALIEVAAGLAKDKDSFQQVAEAFKDAGINQTRFVQAMSVLGANADYFRDKINLASAAVNDNAAIVDGATAKQNTFAATLDKVKKSFEKLGTSKTVQIMMMAIASAIGLIAGNIQIILPLIAALSAAYAIHRARLAAIAFAQGDLNKKTLSYFILKGAQLIQAKAQNALEAIRNLRLKTQIALTVRSAQATGLAAVATKGLATAIDLLLGPVGLVIAGIITLTTVVGVFNANARESVAVSKLLQEANRKVAEEVADHTAKIKTLIGIVTNANIADSEREKALQKLRDISPDLVKGYTLEANAVEKLNQNTQKYIATLTQRIKLSVYEESLTKATKGLADAQQELNDSADRLSKMKTFPGMTSVGPTGAQIGNTSDLLKQQLAAKVRKDRETVKQAEKDVAIIQAQIGNIYEAGTKDAIEAQIKSLQNIQQAYGKLSPEYKEIEDKIKGLNDELTKLTHPEKMNGGKSEKFEVDIANMQADLKALNDQINTFKGSNADFKKLIAERDTLQNQLNTLLEKGSHRPGRKSGLSGAMQDALRDQDTLRDQLLAEAETERLDKQKQNKLSLDDEVDYLNKVLQINRDAIDKKLALIKGNGTAENAERAKLKLERIKDEQDTNSKIFDLRSDALKKQIELEVKTAQAEADRIKNDPAASETAKAQAQLDADKKRLQIYEDYTIKLHSLEKLNAQESLKIEKDNDASILKTHQDLYKDMQNLDEASLKDLETKTATDVAKFQAMIKAKILKVQNSDLSKSRKEQAITLLQNQEEQGTLAIEVSNMQKELPVYDKLLAEKKVTDLDYLKFKADLLDKENALADLAGKNLDKNLKHVSDIKSLLQRSFRDIFKIDPNSENDQLLAQTISETYDLALDSINNFYDQKQARADQDLQTQLKQLDAEKQAAEDHAQTQAEKNAIDAEYQKKEDALQKQAFEKKKKAQLAQAAINLGVQLSNIAVSAFSPLFIGNDLTAGAAGAIMYSIQAAVALGQYALNVSRIKNAQYEQGGQPGDVPTRGGKFGGKPHSQGGTPFGYKGQTYEAEVDELSVIRTKNAPRNKVFTITGNHTQIASALNELGGGISFAGGASIRKMASGGHLGEVLQPPVFAPSMNNVIVQNNSSLEKKFDDLADKFENLANEQSKRIDRLEVVQVTGTVTKAQRKQTKQTSIGTLS